MSDSMHDRPLEVLFVDDDREVLDSFRLFLETAGLDVTTADNGQDAIDAAVAQRPHVIVLDLAMPKVDGRAILNALQERAETAQIPVVLFTGGITTALPNSSQVRALIQKPCLPSNLLAVIRRVGGQA
jgi:CheY-like chemotaxis protein